MLKQFFFSLISFLLLESCIFQIKYSTFQNENSDQKLSRKKGSSMRSDVSYIQAFPRLCLKERGEKLCFFVSTFSTAPRPSGKAVTSNLIIIPGCHLLTSYLFFSLQKAKENNCGFYFYYNFLFNSSSQYRFYCQIIFLCDSI